MTDDRKALVDFTDRFGGLAGSAGNALAILGRADQIGDGTGEQWETPRRWRRARRRSWRARLDRHPLVGLLAESAAHLRARDTQNLVALAALDGATRGSVLGTYPELLLSVDSAVSVQDRQRLIALLGRFPASRVSSRPSTRV